MVIPTMQVVAAGAERPVSLLRLARDVVAETADALFKKSQCDNSNQYLSSHSTNSARPIAKSMSTQTIRLTVF